MTQTGRQDNKPSLDDYRLYFVTDPRLHKGYEVLDQVALALRGGVKIIQIREKEGSREDSLTLASRALRLTRAYGAYLIINDSVDIALSSGADGVHLGQSDMPLREARNMVGAGMIVGLSVKTVEEAIQGEKDGADYLAVNGVFPTATKEDLGYCPGLEGVAAIRCRTSLPLLGIGGINSGNCRSVIEAGAHGVAVVTAITMADDIPSACRYLLELMK